MKKFDQEKFNNFVIENNVIGFYEKPITLKSKRSSHWYVNWRRVASDVYLIDELTDFIIAFAKWVGFHPDCFYGVPEGATKIALITQYKWALEDPNLQKGKYVLAMGRGKPKSHGDPKDMYFLGAPKGKTIIIEDVTTTGSSLLNTIKQLKELNDVEILAAIGLTNRMEKTPIPYKDDKEILNEFKELYQSLTNKEYREAMSVKDLLEDIGIRYYSMSNALELLPNVVQKLKPEITIVNALEKYFEEYGVQELKLK